MSKAERNAHQAKMAAIHAANAAIVSTGKCPQCGAGGVKVAQIGTAVACGACLTLALQAVQ